MCAAIPTACTSAAPGQVKSWTQRNSLNFWAAAAITLEASAEAEASIVEVVLAAVDGALAVPVVCPAVPVV